MCKFHGTLFWELKIQRTFIVVIHKIVKKVIPFVALEQEVFFAY